MSETQYSDDPLSINEDKFLPLFQDQLRFKGFNESLLSTIRNFNLFDVRDMYENLSKKEIPMLALWGKKDGIVPFSGSDEYQRIFNKGKLIVLEEGTTLESLEKKIRTKAGGKLDGVSLRIALNKQYTSADKVLKNGDEVAFIPPVQGG